MTPEPPKYRATIHHADGSEEDVSEHLHGVDEYMASWAHEPELPQPQRASAWQDSDERHPPGEGYPAYRILYKTLRTVVVPAVNFEFGNVVIRFGNGVVRRGGMRADGVLPGRQEGVTFVPEFGSVEARGSELGYQFQPNMTFNFSGWEDEIAGVNYVEVILRLDPGVSASTSYDEKLLQGRTRVAPATAMIDLMLGPRILGMPLLEEVGATFDDWHWNRAIDVRSVSAESQVRMNHVDGRVVMDGLSGPLSSYTRNSAAEKNRISLASRWYWRADRDLDPITRYIAWWIVIESLEMPGTTNIAEVKKRVADLLGTDVARTSTAVGKLFGVRGDLVHGSAHEVSTEHLDLIEGLAKVILAFQLASAIPIKEAVRVRNAIQAGFS